MLTETQQKIDRLMLEKYRVETILPWKPVGDLYWQASYSSSYELSQSLTQYMVFWRALQGSDGRILVFKQMEMVDLL